MERMTNDTPYWKERLSAHDTISRQAAIDGADAVIARDTSGNNDVVKAMTAWKNYVEALPPAQPVRKKGKRNRLSSDTFHCRECGGTFIVIQGADYMNYCPNCGADMRGDADE